MKYAALSGADFVALRRERIALLEGEHFRLALRLDETTNPDDAAMLLGQQAELERRILLHRGPLDEPEVAAVVTEDAIEH